MLEGWAKSATSVHLHNLLPLTGNYTKANGSNGSFRELRMNGRRKLIPAGGDE